MDTASKSGQPMWNGHNDSGEDHAGAPRRAGEKPRDLDDVRLALVQWFETRVPGSAPAPGMLSRPVGAGGSNETILFELTADLFDGQGRTLHNLVLRIEPGDYRLFREVDIERQFALMRTLSSCGIKVPMPLFLEPDPGWFGHAFFIMTRAAGKVPVSSPPYNRSGFLADATPAQRNLAWRTAVGELGRIHALDTRPFEHLWPRGAEVGPEEDFLEQERSYHWARGGADAPFLFDVLSWLKSNRPQTVPAGLSWGDSRLGNMVFGADFNLAAVLDWEQASFGGPLRDLGWWLFFDDLYSEEIGLDRLEGLGTRGETISLWQSASGRIAADLHWYEVYAGFQLGVLMMRRCELQGRAQPGANRNNNIFNRKVAKMLGMNQPTDILN